MLKWLAILTMFMGNLVALPQHNIKRMLAWSSIAHAGYLLLGVLTLMSPADGGSLKMLRGNEISMTAGSAVLFYLVGYSLMNLAAFGLVNVLGNGKGEEGEDINRYAGLSRRKPLAAAALAVAMLSLAGIPPFVGFMGKFYLFEAVVNAGMVNLAIIGVIKQPDLGVLLPARHRGHVHEAGRGRQLPGSEWVSVVASSVLILLVIYMGVQPHAFYQAAARVFLGMAF